MNDIQFIVYSIIVFIIIALWGGVMWWAFRKDPRPTYEPPAITEWRVTGVADFLGSDAVMLSEQDDVPAQFVLRIQEQRQVANIAGTPMTEYRWRLATKAEARDIVQTVAIYRKDR